MSSHGCSTLNERYPIQDRDKQSKYTCRSGSRVEETVGCINGNLVFRSESAKESRNRQQEHVATAFGCSFSFNKESREKFTRILTSY